MLMKRLFTLMIVALLATGISHACMRKSISVDYPITVIVMDTTQALLPDVQVSVGDSIYRTSYDGRVVLQPAQLNGVKKIVVSKDGYQSCSVRPDGELAVVKLTPKRVKKSGGEYGGPVLSMRGTRTGVFYREAAVSADAVYAEEEIVTAAYSKSLSVPAANSVSAGQLTAGEVNDFAKWLLWSSVLDQTHANFIQDWRIAPRQRYTVQVMNKDGFPVANYPVSLTDGNNTLFQAVTDNTGKAELWGNLITTQERTMVREPEKTIIIDEPCDVSDDVDVLFVFDATGSMGDELHYLQAEMKDVIARAEEATGGLAIRTGAVVYRDHGDEYLTRISRLTDDIKTTQAFIDKQQANGGGDYPEAVPEALMAALNSAGWDANARARIAFLILDAPCHNDSASVTLLHEQILNAAALGVRVVPVVCSGLDKSGELLMRSIALVTNGTSFFLTDDSGIGNPHLQPTTDSLKVEHLNDMMVRTIVEFSTMPLCTDSTAEISEDDKVDGQFVPNPFDAKDLEANPSIPHGNGKHYLVDVSGKLIAIMEGDVDDVQSHVSRYDLPAGVYFLKTYVDGRWFTRKILIR